MTVSWLSELAGFALPMAVGAAATAIYYRWESVWPRVDAWITGPVPAPPLTARPHVYLVADDRPYDWAKVSGAGRHLGTGERRGAPESQVPRSAPEGRSAP